MPHNQRKKINEAGDTKTEIRKKRLILMKIQAKKRQTK